MSKKHIGLSKVQQAFNKAIVRRDGHCRIQDGAGCCAGGLQCSHFFPVGGNSGLRFYPYNAFCQCAGHHFTHHSRDPVFYYHWLKRTYPDELAWMTKVRGTPVRYSQSILYQIYESCSADDLDAVRSIIRGLLRG